MTLALVPGRFAVCRFDPKEVVPPWAYAGDFYSVTRTMEELSVVCREDRVPEGVTCEAGWACLKVKGPLDFSLTGVLASLAAPLAEAGLSLFAVSTFDTDYLLVKAHRLDEALGALSKEGHTLRSL